ncbi:MAG: DUF493 domain-containing protein [Gammaproteobacteria bacterium]|nr:DUF493 domain-containing protein [Gammaproteobacteria bacterium]
MKETLMVFPCDFPIKIIGKSSPHFVADINKLVRQHFPDTPDANITSKLSGEGKYQSITAVVHALNQKSLDDLYKDISDHPDIQMVL